MIMRLLTLALTLCVTSLNMIHGQTISLTFTATFNGSYQPLDSIHVANLTQGGDTTLYGSDTVLVLEHGIGIGDMLSGHTGQMILYPPIPNPVTHTATIMVFLPQETMVTLRAHDMPGRELATHRQFLPAGYHTFSFTPGREACYLLSVEASGQQQVQKLISLNGSGSHAVITHSGTRGVLNTMRGSLAGFPWAPGDQLRFIGYSATGADTIDDNPGQSNSYTFQMISTVSPPTAQFSVSDTLISINDTVQFTDLSSGNPASWKWYFGDGDSSMQQTPSHIYNQLGMYTITLIVSNIAGGDTLTKQNLITVATSGSGCPGIVSDINGNVYNTILIGTQCWMKENLKVRNYKNGTAIPLVTNYSTWMSLSTGARCWNNNDSASYAAIYGSLYNWSAVVDANGLCPSGWHVPTDLEWKTLEMHLGMSQAQADSTGYRGNSEGSKLKEAGTIHWNSPNTGATNSSGFTAVPGGYCYNSVGGFVGIGAVGWYWTASPGSASTAWQRGLQSNNIKVCRDDDYRTDGISVRCVRD